MQQTQSTATDTAEVAIALVQNLSKVNDKKQEATQSKDNVAEESESLTGRYPKAFRRRHKEDRKKAGRKAAREGKANANACQSDGQRSRLRDFFRT